MSGDRMALAELLANGSGISLYPVWHTWSGTVSLKITELRYASYFPSFLERGRSSEQAMTAVIQ